MDVRLVDPQRPDETGFAAAHAACRDAFLSERPWASYGSAAERLADLRHDDPGSRKGLCAAWEGDAILGVASGGFRSPTTGRWRGSALPFRRVVVAAG
ncbi:MAG: hypothetical protein ACR2F6_13425 [Mycobacteriales bacterium]